MAYVPPALRRKQQQQQQQQQQAAELEGSIKDNTAIPISTTVDFPSLDDIQKYFWPTLIQNAQQSVDDDQSKHNALTDDNPDHMSHIPNTQIGPGMIAPISRKAHSTLNATEVEPYKLRYVLLFRDAHPRWKEDNIIYVKTDIHLLPQDASEAARDGVSDVPLERNIMVFEQHADFVSQVSSRARFQFVGFYHLERIQIHEPKTPELVRMLEQKWTRTNKWGKSRQIARDSKGWQKSLSYRWAVLKFMKADEAGLSLSPPKIEVSQSDDRAHGKENMPAKSVNEMLRGLRVQDQWKLDAEVRKNMNV